MRSMMRKRCARARTFFVLKPDRDQGFTLVELMVVLAIIGVLLAVGIPAFNESRAKARDDKRISDLKQLEFALEVYQESQGGFPDTGGPVVIGEGAEGSIDELLAPFMGAVPKDPLGSTDDNKYEYVYDPNSPCGVAVYAKTMEREENANAGATCSGLSGRVVALGGWSIADERLGDEVTEEDSTSSGKTVFVLEQKSSSACTKDVSWGYDDTKIWVDDGCRAIFADLTGTCYECESRSYAYDECPYSSSQRSCPGNSQTYSYNDDTYFYVDRKFKRDEAEEYAAQAGGQLIVFSSAEESEFFADQIGEEVWIGLSQDLSSPDYSEPDGAWEWADGTPLTPSDPLWDQWDSDEPNNDRNREHWAHLKKDGTWNDEKLDKDFKLLIEFE